MASLEQLKNNASTTIAEDLTDVETDVTVADGSIFPATGNFRVLCGDEIMLCTARSSNDLTVERGAESTVAAEHTSGDPIYGIITAGAISALTSQRFPLDSATYTATKGQLRIPHAADPKFLEYYDGAAWHKYGPTQLLPVTNKFVIGDYTATNVADATLTSYGEYCDLVLTSPTANHSMQMWIESDDTLAAGLNTLIAAWSVPTPGDNSTDTAVDGFFGIVLYDGTKICAAGWREIVYSANSVRLVPSLAYWADVSTLSANLEAYTAGEATNSGGIFWVKVTYNRTTDRIYFYTSQNGVDWVEIATDENIGIYISDIAQYGIGASSDGLTRDPTYRLWYFSKA